MKPTSKRIILFFTRETGDYSTLSLPGETLSPEKENPQVSVVTRPHPDGVQGGLTSVQWDLARRALTWRSHGVHFYC